MTHTLKGDTERVSYFYCIGTFRWRKDNKHSKFHHISTQHCIPVWYHSTSSIFVVQYGGVPFETVNVLDENNNPGVREAHVRLHILLDQCCWWKKSGEPVEVGSLQGFSTIPGGAYFLPSTVFTVVRWYT